LTNGYLLLHSEIALISSVVFACGLLAVKKANSFAKRLSESFLSFSGMPKRASYCWRCTAVSYCKQTLSNYGFLSLLFSFSWLSNSVNPPFVIELMTLFVKGTVPGINLSGTKFVMRSSYWFFQNDSPTSNA